MSLFQPEIEMGVHKNNPNFYLLYINFPNPHTLDFWPILFWDRKLSQRITQYSYLKMGVFLAYPYFCQNDTIKKWYHFEGKNRINYKYLYFIFRQDF